MKVVSWMNKFTCSVQRWVFGVWTGWFAWNLPESSSLWAIRCGSTRCSAVESLVCFQPAGVWWTKCVSQSPRISFRCYKQLKNHLSSFDIPTAANTVGTLPIILTHSVGLFQKYSEFKPICLRKLDQALQWCWLSLAKSCAKNRPTSQILALELRCMRFYFGDPAILRQSVFLLFV